MDHQLLEFNATRGASLEGGLVREIVISTEKPVRSGGGIARAAGAVLGAYLRNPVVMWGHDYRQPPIARATSLDVQPGVGISARFEFPAAGVYSLADTVRGLWDAGFINAASIGFMPLEWEMIDDPEGGGRKAEGGGMKAEGGRLNAEKIPVFSKWELYEFSLVAVPRDREAVRRAMDCMEWPHDGASHRDAVSAAAIELVARVTGAAAPQATSLDLQRILDGLRAVKVAYHG